LSIETFEGIGLVKRMKNDGMLKVALVGAGNMGFAMLCRWAAVSADQLVAIEPNDALRARAAQLGIDTYGSREDLPADCRIDVLVLAVKPQSVRDVVSQYSGLLSPEALVISIAAGVELQAIADGIGRPVAVFRAMPNTPAAIGEGMIVCCGNEIAQRPPFVALAERLLSSIGRVAFVEDERLMDAVTAVSGSGPAYVFHFIEALAEAGRRAGLDETFALLLAKQTCFGAAKLAIQSKEMPSLLRQQVTSPNGTTAAALSVLMSGETSLTALLTTAVEAARVRSEELRD
jgi:pyrroline-5-carboxylate reductase